MLITIFILMMEAYIYMESGNITFKGMKDALIIMLNEEQGFEELLDELGKKLEASAKFLKGVNYPIKVRGRNFNPVEFSLIAQKIKNVIGLDISDDEHKDKDEKHEKDKDDKDEKEKPKRVVETPAKGDFYGIDEGMTKFYRGTLRSGQLLKFHGNIVVIGDANPGSEIVASGNIVVLGTIRGIVHAGATGNKDAVIVAFNLQPTQLRIADVITRPPEEKVVSKAVLPEIAFVKDSIVYIEYYLPNK